MAIKKQHMQIATAITASLRSLAFAGAMIALAAAPMARADSAIAPTAATGSATVIQNANILPPSGGEEESQTPAKFSREYLIKAALLFNIARFASWPETAFSDQGAPLRVCVIGSDPFGAALDSLHGKLVRSRTLAIARIHTIEAAPKCHILFVSASESDRLEAILDSVGALPILTVADMGQFARSGGIIALKEVDNRSRIEVNIGAADLAGVKLSAKLLSMADTVGTRAALRAVR